MRDVLSSSQGNDFCIIESLRSTFPGVDPVLVQKRDRIFEWRIEKFENTGNYNPSNVTEQFRICQTSHEMLISVTIAIPKPDLQNLAEESKD